MQIAKTKALFLLLFLSSFSFANENYYQDFAEHRVYYSVFSSTGISAKMAQQYGLVRGKDRVYVNIAVVPKGQEFGGINATVTGSAKNLIQQNKQLAFKGIVEPNAVYYLALLRHTNREVFHFTIDVDPDGPGGPYTLKFTKELYVNP